ncbi:MAG: hypothetical protein Q7J27_10880, partial [Syntrophales bacterium]|nr:hypothetical protein [Syntrophales bacterium]
MQRRSLRQAQDDKGNVQHKINRFYEVKLPVASHGASLFKAKLGEANPASPIGLRRVVTPFIPVASHRALWR